MESTFSPTKSKSQNGKWITILTVCLIPLEKEPILVPFERFGGLFSTEKKANKIKRHSTVDCMFFESLNT